MLLDRAPELGHQLLEPRVRSVHAAHPGFDVTQDVEGVARRGRLDFGLWLGWFGWMQCRFCSCLALLDFGIEARKPRIGYGWFFRFVHLTRRRPCRPRFAPGRARLPVRCPHWSNRNRIVEVRFGRNSSTHPTALPPGRPSGRRAAPAGRAGRMPSLPFRPAPTAAPPPAPAATLW